MKTYSKPVQVRWSDLDPNVHLRHSVYYDWGAFCRISALEELKLSSAAMQQLQVGPILFREECVFKREIRLGDEVTIDLQVAWSKKDYARWAIRHSVWKNTDTLSAIITVEGAWLDLVRRKLATPPEQVQAVFAELPKAEDFQWLG